MGFEILLTVLFILLLLNFVILDCRVSKMKKDRLKLDVVTAITALEMAVKKLNEKLRYNTQSLSDYKRRLKRLENRLDILEAGHPDTDIDYGTVDDDGNIIEVWFEGKRYVPEDKRGKDTITLYADNKVVAETSRPDPQPEYIVKLNYLASDTECDELLKRVERLNRIYDAGLMSLSEYGERLKELMQNDT